MARPTPPPKQPARPPRTLTVKTGVKAGFAELFRTGDRPMRP